MKQRKLLLKIFQITVLRDKLVGLTGDAIGALQIRGPLDASETQFENEVPACRHHHGLNL